ncbi:MAG: RNA polymerase sigma factor [Deltaproteobacteria bacterium]|nr:RNA polymerase sigma factor [Deltaproteobacteria bacterium]
MHEPEQEQVREAQRGDILAMSRLLDELSPFVARLCGGIALEHGDDAAQEALVQILRDLPTLREPGALRGWARRIAVREAIRHAQRGRRHGGVDAQAIDESDSRAVIPVHAADPAVALDVRSVLERLSPEQRAILVLRDLEGLSEDEAAAQLGVATGTVKSRLARAREAFRKRWTE